jgi:hypothetical protein
MTLAGVADELGKLSAEFPGWHVWQSSAGRLWAVGLGDVHIPGSPDPGWAMTVDADTPYGLRIALKAQEMLSLAVLSSAGG